LTEPKGLCPSSFAKYFTLSFVREYNLTIGVFPMWFMVSASVTAVVAIIISPF